ncbi:Cysteine desulfurase CsdA, partial [Haemophilus influenzae]
FTALDKALDLLQ